ncbi:hypothetical protein Poly51_49310 [Rubripirellula tenax]|uniref:Uncharacterized protein n=1 Tax=Rubripirellula tenax TaxID=2528015 RepID=A0A5C6ELM5_9BACT|nr:hypothetical protein [Rubripirellula tenax]TWU49027.1 hypothetical protein Poly51_49310 [Rubripirellula tenax]
MDLNPGGLVGGLVGAGAGIAIMFVASSADGNQPRGKGLILFVTVGAFVGNFVWGKVFPKKQVTESDGQSPSVENVRDDEYRNAA